MTEATVQMLTASVRTLQIGARQVTLSVAKQLDIVGPGMIEPWGRVDLGREDLTVVGRDLYNDALVTSTHDDARCDDCEEIAERFRKHGPRGTYSGFCATRRAWSQLPKIVLAGLK